VLGQPSLGEGRSFNKNNITMVLKLSDGLIQLNPCLISLQVVAHTNLLKLCFESVAVIVYRGVFHSKIHYNNIFFIFLKLFLNYIPFCLPIKGKRFNFKVIKKIYLFL
jgi:hypothetical protein